jgi:hypothetical protein
MRKALPGVAGKKYDVSDVGKAVVKGITRRSRAVHVPGWVGRVKLFRAFTPVVVERRSRTSVPQGDRAMLDDIARRGAEESSRPVGPGGAAATR